MKTKIFLAFFMLTAAGVFYFYGGIDPASPSGVNKKENAGRVVLRVAEGDGVAEISQKLKGAGLIESHLFFKIYAFWSGGARFLRAGRYFLPADLGVAEIIDLLKKGPADVRVTIAPGMTIKEIDDVLGEAGVTLPGEILNYNPESILGDFPWLTKMQSQDSISSSKRINLEGFLLPDTYEFKSGSEPREVVRKILNNFERRVLPLIGQEGPEGFRLIITASLLEKEAQHIYDQQLIAGIIYKRLKMGMPLQVDATVVYAVCESKFRGCPRLKDSDFSADSLYNTYLHAGLPPSPIANPGLSAISAAVNPIKSSYLYYLSDPLTQKIIFAETLDEHNANRVRYLFKS